MNPEDQEDWRDEALDFILVAVAKDHELNECLIFKGARLMHGRVSTMRRRSLDIDATIAHDPKPPGATPVETAAWFEAKFKATIRLAADAEVPIRYGLEALSVTPSPKRTHPHGWQGFSVRVNFVDRRQPSRLGNPALTIDLAATEHLGPKAIETILLRDVSLHAYSIARQTAEKLRAILQSLPAYRLKLGSREQSVRVKDIADLSNILNDHPLAEDDFWETVATEFVAACRDRLVDCAGWDSFAEEKDVTERAYSSDATLQKEKSFNEAWTALASITSELERRGLFPISNPLPKTES